MELDLINGVGMYAYNYWNVLLELDNKGVLTANRFFYRYKTNQITATQWQSAINIDVTHIYILTSYRYIWRR